MKKEPKIIFTIVVAAILVVAGYFIMTADASEWTVPWSDNSVFGGEWQTAIIIGFADGTIQSFEDIQEGDTLAVHYQGAEYSYVQWVLKATATTPVGAGVWDDCEIDVSHDATFSLLSTIKSGPGTTYYTNTNDFSQFDPPMAMPAIPVDDAVYHMICGDVTIDLNDVMDNAPAEDYILKYTPSGTLFYRGIGDGYPSNPDDHGDWVSIDPPPTISFTISVNAGPDDVTIDFQADVNWW